MPEVHYAGKLAQRRTPAVTAGSSGRNNHAMATTIIEEGQPGSKAWFRDSFLLHKLHSLTGVIPIGAFVIFHLVANSYSLRGEVEFNTVTRVIGYSPFVVLLEIAAIFAPLLFHAIYGLFITAEARPNNGAYTYGRNWLYLLQRITGIVAFAYIIFHVWSTTGIRRMYEFTGGADGHEMGYVAISYAAMAWRMADPLYLAAYVIGITASAFHLANGLFNFGIRWGITIGETAQRISAYLWAGLGIALAVIGLWTAINFYNVGRDYKGQGPIRQTYSSLDALIKSGIPVRALPQPGATPTSPTGGEAPLQ